MEQAEKKEPSLEEVLEELDQIIHKMQNREATLEDSFALYEQGIQKLKVCSQKIDLVEKTMLLLTPQGGLEPFGELEP